MTSPKSKNVLFVNMVNPGREIENLYPALGPTYLVSYCKKHLKNTINFRMISDDFEKVIEESKPDVIGISCVSQNYDRAKKLATFAKKVGIKFIMIGGSHISLYPESLDPKFDIGVVGEGEVTFLKLMECITGGGLSPRSKRNIDGIVYWEKDKLIITQPRELIKNLDDLPLPDRSLFVTNKEKAYMFTSRGCPYRCVFCASSRLWKNVRFHSAEYVFNEIQLLVNKYGVKNIDFYDDLFIVSLSRVAKLADLIIGSGIDKKVQFHVSARANLVNDEICTLLKKMNVKGVSLGLESGSKDILTYLKGESVSVEDNYRAVATIKKHGLYCVASFIIGSPQDTKETILDTLNFIKKSNLDEFMVYSLTPLPGTPVWEYAVAEGIIPKDSSNFDWSKIDVEYARSHQYNIHLAKNINKDDFYKLYQMFERVRLIKNIKRGLYLLINDTPRFLYHLSRKISFLAIRHT